MLFFLLKWISLKCYDALKIFLSFVILYTGLRLATIVLDFILLFYSSCPTDLLWFLDAFYFRSPILQRHFSFRLSSSSSSSASLLSGSRCEELARQAGLTFESHPVTTADGYTLTLHRCYLDTSVNITPKDCLYSSASSQSRESNSNPKPPVFLMHGLMQDSESFLCGGGDSLGSTLARAGFDVWLGNNRGNKYSRDPGSRPSPWDFSVDQLAQYDLPAAVTFITAHTGYPKVSYVGFSQGSTQAFAALSGGEASRKIGDKLSIFIALAPAVYPRGFRDSLISSFCLAHSQTLTPAVFGSSDMLPLAAAAQKILSPSSFASLLVDAERVAMEVKSCVYSKKIVGYEHLDMIWSDSAPADVFPFIVSLLRQHPSTPWNS